MTPAIVSAVERWPIRGVFRTAKVERHETTVVVVRARAEGHEGRGECVPYDGYGETVPSVLAQLEGITDPSTLPPGAARNGLELAWLDLECKRTDARIHTLLGCVPFRGCRTAFTIGMGPPKEMERAAREHATFATLKLKASPISALASARAVHRGAPEARLVIDGNESWSAADLERLAAPLAEAGVTAFEQPLARDADGTLRRGALPIPVYADESCHSVDDVARLADRYDGVNIKLGKTGGLRAALAVRDEARRLGLRVMVGCAVSTSLAIAPALVVAADADLVDLDGPLLLARDREPALVYEGDRIAPFDPALWG